MLRNRHLLAGLLTCSLLTAAGCTTPQAVVRGQSLHSTQIGAAPQGNLTTVQDAFHEHGVQHTSYHSATGFPGYGGYGAYAADCPPGLGGYGAYSHCPTGHCGHGACTCPHHYHSYSYSRPGNLKYPQGPAGAVVYPYYTLRGPSDFFRTK